MPSKNLKSKVSEADILIISLVLAVSLVVALTFLVKDRWQSCQASYVKKGLTQKAAKAKCEKHMQKAANDAYDIWRYSQTLDPLDLVD